MACERGFARGDVTRRRGAWRVGNIRVRQTVRREACVSYRGTWWTPWFEVAMSTGRDEQLTLDKLYLAGMSDETCTIHTLWQFSKRGVIVGHMPRAISSVCYVFLRKNGELMCEVTGTRNKSADLPQGGLEIPCRLEYFFPVLPD